MPMVNVQRIKTPRLVEPTMNDSSQEALKNNIVHRSDESAYLAASLELVYDPITPDIEKQYMENKEDLEIFGDLKKTVLSILTKCFPSHCELEKIIKTDCVSLLIKCATKSNSLLAIDIFYFINGLAGYFESRHQKSTFIPWSLIYTNVLLSIMKSLSKVNLEILAGISRHCKLMDIQYPDPLSIEVEPPRNYISECIFELSKKPLIGSNTLVESHFGLFAREENKITYSQAIAVMFYIRSKAYHEQIKLEDSFYYALVDGFGKIGVAPIIMENLLYAFEAELSTNPVLLLGLQRKIIFYLATLQSARLLSNIKNFYTQGVDSISDVERQRSLRILNDPFTMNIIISNLFLRSISITNMESHPYNSGEFESSKRKAVADFLLAKKFYSFSISRCHPSMLEYNPGLELKIDLSVDYFHFQILQHLSYCALLACGELQEAMEQFVAFWVPSTLSCMLTNMRIGFLHDFFNIIFTFSLSYDQVLSPMLRHIGVSFNKAEPLLHQLFLTRPIALVPLFFSLSSSGSPCHFMALLKMWRDWVYLLHDKYKLSREDNEPHFLPWVFSMTNMGLISVSRHSHPHLKKKDFLWTPLFLDIIVSVMIGSYYQLSIKVHSPTYNLSPVTLLSDIYFLTKNIKPSILNVNPKIASSINLFILNELSHTDEKVNWEPPDSSFTFSKFCTPTQDFLSSIPLQLFSFFNLLDAFRLSSLCILYSHLAFEAFVRMFFQLSMTEICSFPSFDKLKRDLVSLLVATHSTANEVIDLFTNLPTPNTRLATPLQAYSFINLSSCARSYAGTNKGIRNPFIPSSTITLFLKSLAISNHWKLFFQVLKDHISSIPLELRAILWFFKDHLLQNPASLQDLKYQRLIFPQINFHLDDNGTLYSTYPPTIFGDCDSTTTALSQLVDLLHASKILLFNKFELHDQLCKVIITKLECTSIFQLRFKIDWVTLESTLVSEVDLSLIEFLPHINYSISNFSKDVLIKRFILYPLRDIVFPTEFMRNFSMLINYYL